MPRLTFLALCLLLFVGCDSADDADGALLRLIVETPSGTAVDGLDITMEYALGDGRSGGDRIARPADITYFDVYARGDAPFVVEWGTSGEDGVARFVIEAARDEDEFEPVAEVAPQGAGTPYEVEVERDVDFALFRLRIDNADGSVAYSETVEPISVAEEDPPANPGTVRLYTGYPNPFSGATTLGLELPRATSIVLDVLDLEGRPMLNLVRDERTAGQQSVEWEADDELAGGYYRVRLIAETDTASVLAVYTGSGVEGQDEPLRVRTALGTTGADGQLTVEDRARFPQFYDDIEAEYRDENNVMLGVFVPAREVTFILRDGAGNEQRFERTLTDGANRFDLTWEPE